MFNTSIIKQAYKVTYFLQKSEAFRPPVSFNEIPVECKASQNDLGLHLNQKLDSEKHIN